MKRKGWLFVVLAMFLLVGCSAEADSDVRLEMEPNEAALAIVKEEIPKHSPNLSLEAIKNDDAYYFTALEKEDIMMYQFTYKDGADVSIPVYLKREKNGWKQVSELPFIDYSTTIGKEATRYLTEEMHNPKTKGIVVLHNSL
ncbi:hypothetical protein [Listeria booriae]|uniref:Lipoprotein n=1 Tax=Listeria booriae TaxID=1552123 RepID=A0A842A2Q8_9LIST|nr:hypothetical protein [Listeria booriae]MBC1566877.1 hypothetical protein [Listeria booriae]